MQIFKSYLPFKPLFFIDSFKKNSSNQVKDIDLCFIATLSPARANMFLWLNDFCKKNKLRLFVYFYIKPYVWFFNKNKKDEYKAVPQNILHGSGLSLEKVCKLFQRSKVIVDCPSPDQSGLTMRTIESFGANKKIVTTNKTIDSYDFFDSRNHLIFDANSEERLLSFIQNDSYSKPDSILYHKYSLQGWIEEIFSMSNN